MSIDRTKLNFLSLDQVDKVLDYFEGSFSIDDGTTVWETISTATSETVLYQGIWSFDGSNWQDLNGYSVNDVGLGRAAAYGGQLKVHGANLSGSSATFQYKIAVIAKDNQTSYDVKPTNQIISKDSQNNTEKIAVHGVLPITVSASSTVNETIAHGLGYVPNARCFVEFLTNVTDVYLGNAPFLRLMSDDFGNAASNSNSTGVTTEATVDATNLYMSVTNNSGSTVTANLHYRIYYA